MKARVLIVDDERVILDCFTAILTGAGFQVQAAASAAEAISTLKQGTFELVITDIAMESQTAGYEVIRAATEQPYRPNVVILTAFPIPAAEWKAQGVKALFLKAGQGPGELIDGIKAILARSLREPDNGNVDAQSAIKKRLSV